VTERDLNEQPGSTPVAAAEGSTTGVRWFAADVAVRWLGWLVPVALFGWLFHFRLLDITRVFPLLRGDWAMFIAAPNFVRDGPWLTFPIGRIPGFMAPVGTWLGQTDSWPILYPLYRALSVVMPHRPFQLIGWQLLFSMLMTFGVVRRYLRIETAEVIANRLRAEVVATTGAVILLMQPYYLLRIGHSALFQMWVIPWALIVTTRLLEQRHGADVKVTTFAFVAPLTAAAALNPYLALMLLPVMCVPLMATARDHLRESVIRLGAALVTVFGVLLTLGYIGTGGRAQSDGFGLYTADAGLLFDAGSLSRTWPNLPPDLTYEGNGFPGTALLLLVIAVATTIMARRIRNPDSEHSTFMWPLWVGVGLSMLWAMMPVIQIFDRELFDLTGVLSHFPGVTASVRSNGRFAWPLLWLIALLTVRYLARQPRVLSHAVLVIAAVVQVVDAVPPKYPTAEDQYGPAMAIVREAVATGIRRIEFQPPNVWSDCPAWEWGPFENIAQLVVAGAVEGLEVNSGYAARGDDRLLLKICDDQRTAYLAGRLKPDVLYVLPPGAEPISSELLCRPTDLMAIVCRLPRAPDTPTRDG
jgi:hypothetical protein